MTEHQAMRAALLLWRIKASDAGMTCADLARRENMTNDTAQKVLRLMQEAKTVGFVRKGFIWIDAARLPAAQAKAREESERLERDRVERAQARRNPRRRDAHRASTWVPPVRVPSVWALADFMRGE